MVLSVAQIVRWQYEVGWSANDTNGRVVGQVGRGASAGTMGRMWPRMIWEFAKGLHLSKGLGVVLLACPAEVRRTVGLED